MKISEVIERINGGTGLPNTADEINVGRDRLTEFIKSIGYAWDKPQSKWLAKEAAPIINENIYDHVQQKGKRKPKSKTQKSTKEIKQDVNYNGSTESKPSKKPMIKPIEEPVNKPPKKVTYEIDEDLHIDLRMMALKGKRNVSELVEEAIRQFLNK